MLEDVMNYVGDPAMRECGKHPRPIGRSPECPTCSGLTKRWAEAMARKEAAEDEVKKARAELEPKVHIGFSDENLVVGESDDLDLEDKRLRQVLHEEGVLKKCLVEVLVAGNVHAAAKFNERVARAVDRATKPKPRWLQAAKKKSP